MILSASQANGIQRLVGLRSNAFESIEAGDAFVR